MEPRGQDAFASATLAFNENRALRVRNLSGFVSQSLYGHARTGKRIWAIVILPGLACEFLLANSATLEPAGYLAPEPRESPNSPKGTRQQDPARLRSPRSVWRIR